MHASLTKLTQNMRLPVIAAPLFIVSHPELVLAQCQAGVIGSFPSLNARPIEQLDDWLYEIKEKLADYDKKHPDQPSAPFAVNQIVHKTNSRLDQDLELCVKHKVPMVISSLGAVEEVNHAVHSYGGIVLHDIINDRFAHKAIDKGADGLIAVAAGAGGHCGPLSPFALVQEIRQWFDGPLALSGCIATGGSILAALSMGADFAYIGSPFIATNEARAPEGYKEMIASSKADDITTTRYFTGITGSYLKPSILQAGLDPETLPNEKPETGDKNKSDNVNFEGEKDGKKPWRDIWSAGQGIATIQSVGPTEQLVNRWEQEFAAAKSKLAA